MCIYIYNITIYAHIHHVESSMLRAFRVCVYVYIYIFIVCIHIYTYRL